MTRRKVGLTCVLVFVTATISAAPDFDALSRAVVDELAARSFDKVVERFDQKMAAAMSARRLAATWDTVLGRAGGFKRVVSVQVKPVAQQSDHVVDLTSTFERGNLMVRVAFNDEGKIIGLFFAPAPPAAAPR
jgi:hypothetical protein